MIFAKRVGEWTENIKRVAIENAEKVFLSHFNTFFLKSQPF